MRYAHPMMRFALAMAVIGLHAQTPPLDPVHVGPDVNPPRVISKAEPNYSREAQRARLEGTVLLQFVVDPGGAARDIVVKRSLGLGLDEMAIESASKWRFAPATKNGAPVPVIATIEVNFRLLHRSPEWGLKRAAFEPPQGASFPEVIGASYPSSKLVTRGEITLRFEVDEKGGASDVRTQGGSGSDAEKEIIDAVRRWKFNPGRKDGAPVRVPATFVFTTP